MSDAVSTALWSAVSVTGLFSLVLLSLGTSLGLRVHAGQTLPLLGRDETLRIHRHLTALGTAGLALHIVIAIIDPFTELSALTFIIPFTARTAAVAYGIGTIATWLIIAIVLTSVARRHLPARLWRTVHLSSYAMWALSVAHAVISPSTSGIPGLVTSGACALLVAATALDVLLVRPAPLLLTPSRKTR